MRLRAAKILDFDIENRPLSYLGNDFTTGEITAICASLDAGELHTWLLGWDEPMGMLVQFRHMFSSADIITGHYIRVHDLPYVNGAMLDYKMTPLPPKLVSDTKIDLVKLNGVSKSQESLAAMLGLKEPKIHMNQQEWRVANRLQRLDLARRRVEADVKQHMALRKRLLELHMLGPPRMWYPEHR